MNKKNILALLDCYRSNCIVFTALMKENDENKKEYENLEMENASNIYYICKEHNIKIDFKNFWNEFLPVEKVFTFA